MKFSRSLALFFILFASFLYGQSINYQSFNLNDFAAKNQDLSMNFSASNTNKNKQTLQGNKINIKYESENYIFFQASCSIVSFLQNTGKLEGVYFSFSRPQALADSSIVKHKVNLVHQGLNGIDTSYTGKGVLIGVIDQGIDFNHPDFKQYNGKTRVLRYWDHTISGPNPPQPYNYGVLWDSSAINNGTCASLENGTAHGTTVAGMAAGNAHANFKNKGAAPEADIVVVETNFNLPNWTLTVADACDYIFKVADSLGKRAVINLSVGDYLGSHDGNDPASEFIESLLDLQNGRIVVCAAGNSGNQGKYHVRNSQIDADTSFFWNIPNTGMTVAGPNKILFDLWSDTSDAHYYFGYGADKVSPNYSFRGQSDFHYATNNITTVPLYDTIYNAVGQRIACIETYREIVGGNFHLLSVFQTIDSLAYRYRFMTTGSGMYDAWGGSWMQLSNFMTSIPTTIQYPAIQHYVMPDSLQTIVSSWNCSEKVISVGNIRNRVGYIDKNNNYYQPTSTTPVGKLSENSSKGPNRHGLVKPDISASGDVTLSAGPLWYLTNPANNSTIDQGAFHVRNGGTSMASPLVSGVAALYLQKCKNSNYQQFKIDLMLSALVDPQTGVVPNNGYGYGKINAHSLLLAKNANIVLNAPNGICLGSTATLSFSTTSMLNSVLWSNGSTGLTLTTAFVGPYSVLVEDVYGCVTRSSTVTLGSLTLPYVDAGAGHDICPNTPLVLTGTGTATSYSWLEGIPNGQGFLPSQNQMYHVTGTGSNGCQSMDSVYIGIYDVDPVNYDELTINALTGSNPFNVSQGIPIGGTYSGPGIIGSSFHPTLTGPGDFTIFYSLVDNNGCIASDSSVIHVISDVNVEENQSGNWGIYPNPAQSQINVFGLKNNVSVIILDALGRTVYSASLNSSNSSIDVRNLVAGLYYLKIEGSALKWIKN